MKKIVSIALFGEGDAYGQYLGAFVRAHLNLFPLKEGWKLRVHMDRQIGASRWGRLLAALELISFDGMPLIELRQMGPAPWSKASLWRMAPVFEKDVDYVFCRDLDSCPTPRDRQVCEEFMATERAVGVCHDNPQHVGIMAGLCHFDARKFRAETGIPSLDALYAYVPFDDETWAKGVDQYVLNKVIDRVNGPTLLEHRFNGWTDGRVTPRRRSSGIYACPTWSKPTPDKGYGAGPLVAQADRLSMHLGAAGFDHVAASAFFDRYGSSEVYALVTLAEKAASTVCVREAGEAE